MPNVQQTNLPTQLTMNEFRSAADKAGQFAKGCRFVVRIQPPSVIDTLPEDLHLMCEAVEYPGRGFNVTETRYYGPSQSFPNNTMYNTANMSFLCRTKSPERFFFDEWMEFINPTTSFNFAYPQEYWSRIQIFQLAEYGVSPPGSSSRRMNVTTRLTPQATYGWTLHKAWPTLVNPQQVSWADNDILRLQVTFSYKYWDRPQVSK
jgi:hypothetical protein